MHCGPRFIGIFLLAVCSLAAGQAAQTSKTPPPSNTSPRTDQSQNNGEWKDNEGFTHRHDSGGSSSSKTSLIDLTPPQDDAKLHPNSTEAVREAEDAAGLYEGDEIGGVQEFHPWDPHKAQKDIEVGDFYFRRKNYRAALDRYQEALYFKNNDAIATFRSAQCQEKLGDSDEARKGYEAYLKILPEGPFAQEAHQALARLRTADENPDAPDKTQAHQ